MNKDDETWKEQTQGVHDNNYGDVLMTGGRKRGEKEGWNKRNFETTTDSFLSATNRIIKYLTNTSSLNWSQGSKTTFQISWSRCKEKIYQGSNAKFDYILGIKNIFNSKEKTHLFQTK